MWPWNLFSLYVDTKITFIFLVVHWFMRFQCQHRQNTFTFYKPFITCFVQWMHTSGWNQPPCSLVINAALVDEVTALPLLLKWPKRDLAHFQRKIWLTHLQIVKNRGRCFEQALWLQDVRVSIPFTSPYEYEI
jgi:hypothetical protein